MSALLVALQLMITAPAPAEAPPPPGFLRFCIEFPEECGDEQGRLGYDRLLSRPVLAPYWEGVFSKPSASLRPPATVFGRRSSRNARRQEQEDAVAAASTPAVMSSRELRAIEAVNRDVNWRIRPVSDAQAFGASDYWTLPLAYGERGVGDCEDFVLQKRSDLRKAGFPLSMMSIALVDVPAQQTHAVLLLNTDRGVLVLDNLDSRVRRLSKTSYRVISREGFGSPLQWLAGPAAETAAL